MKLLKHFERLLLLWFILGMIYATLELFWRGVTYLPMIFVGGLCGLCVGLLNQYPRFFNLKMWQQTAIGTVITLAIEFSSGCILNLWMHLGIWDYSSKPFNLYGQICAPMAVVWFFLMPFAIWVDDWLRWKLFDELPPESGVFGYYKDLFTGR